MKLTFTAEVDAKGWEAYKQRYPDFADESAAETLIREAIAAWEWDELVAPGAEGKETED